MYKTARAALVTGFVALSVAVASCAGAPAPRKPSASSAPLVAPSIGAPPAPAPIRGQLVRFPLPSEGTGMLRGYKTAQRTLLRLTDVATGTISEQGTSLERLEHTRALPSGGFETTVVSDVETRDALTPNEKRRTHPGYTVTTVGSQISVRAKAGEVLDPKYEKEVVQRSRQRGAFGDVIELLTRDPFERGKAVPLPAPMLALLDDAAQGSATLVAVEERWQRRVAHLKLEVSRPESADRPQVRGEADLYVETETGRPILLASQLRRSRKWRESGRDVEVNAVDVAERRWGFNRSGDYARSSFSADPAPSTLGNARQIVVAPDERSAAVLMQRPTGGELAVWDLGRRAVRESRASDALFILLDSLADRAVLYEVGAHSITSRVLLPGGMQPFGTVMLADMTFDPSAAAASGPFVAVGMADGRVIVAEPRIGCMLGGFRASLSNIRAMAFLSPERLAVVDGGGQVEVFSIETLGAKVPGPRCGKTSVRSTSKARFKLPSPFTRVDAHAGTLLFTAPSGDVAVWTGSGPARSLGTLGPEATLTQTARGGPLGVTTRLGTTPLTARAAPPGTVRRVGPSTAGPSPHAGVVAVGRSGQFGLSAEGRLVSFFVPGQTRDVARLETFASPVAGAFAHGTTVVAASDDGHSTQALVWNLRTASVRVEGLGSAAATLSATADGARYVLATADRVDVRDTGTDAVVGSLSRKLLAAGSGPLDARLGRGGLSLAVRRADGSLVVHDVATSRAIAELPAASASGRSSFVLSPTEDLLLSVGTDGRLIGTELPSRRARFAVEATTAATAARGTLRVAASLDGEWLAIAGTNRDRSGWNPLIPVVEIRSTKDGKLVTSLSPKWSKITSLAFATDKKLLFAGTDEGELLTWDTASGLLVSHRVAHDRAITSLFATATGAALVSASADGSVRLWDPKVLEEPKARGALGVLEEALAPWRPTQLLATLMVDARGEAVAATGDGYYKADRGSLRTLGLTSGSSRYEFQQFDALLHRPDIVIDRVGAGDDDHLAMFRAAHAKRERVLGALLPRNLPKPPKLVFSRPLPLLANERSLALRLRVEAGEGTLKALHVAVNSVPVGPLGGKPLSGATWTGEVPLTLGAGANRIEVYATDARSATSEISSHVIEYTGPTSPPSLYALVVGVSSYKNPKLNLDFAAKDAKDVGALLATSKRFANVHVHEILDEHATRTEILAARAFLEKARIDDTVVVFLAGHGMLDKDLNYWFATTEIEPKDPARTGLSYEQLTSLVTGLEARRCVVLLDTCHAGEADKTGEVAWMPPALGSGAPATPRVKKFRGLELERAIPSDQSFGLMQQLFTDLRAGSGAIVLGSAGGAELALESARYKNGVFTFALLEALKETRGDADRDGAISATELVRYVRARVEELTRGAQRPATRGENLDLDFPIF